jgi:hypothetical protein
MVFVQSIVACCFRFACPGCLWDYCLSTTLDRAESRQYTTHYAPYRVTSDTQAGIIQQSEPVVQLGKITIFQE